MELPRSLKNKEESKVAQISLAVKVTYRQCLRFRSNSVHDLGGECSDCFRYITQEAISRNEANDHVVCVLPDDIVSMFTCTPKLTIQTPSAPIDQTGYYGHLYKLTA